MIVVVRLRVLRVCWSFTDRVGERESFVLMFGDVAAFGQISDLSLLASPWTLFRNGHADCAVFFKLTFTII